MSRKSGVATRALYWGAHEQTVTTQDFVNASIGWGHPLPEARRVNAIDDGAELLAVGLLKLLGLRVRQLQHELNMNCMAGAESEPSLAVSPSCHHVPARVIVVATQEHRPRPHRARERRRRRECTHERILEKRRASVFRPDLLRSRASGRSDGRMVWVGGHRERLRQ